LGIGVHGLPLRNISSKESEEEGSAVDSSASLRWHYPDQVQRVFLTRPPFSRQSGPLAFAAFAVAEMIIPPSFLRPVDAGLLRHSSNCMSAKISENEFGTLTSTDF
jgi:hypothetical protein